MNRKKLNKLTHEQCKSALFLSEEKVNSLLRQLKEQEALIMSIKEYMGADNFRGMLEQLRK